MLLDSPGLCCNELNAPYAADGYTRIKGSPGVLVTNYAVGELSAAKQTCWKDSCRGYAF